MICNKCNGQKYYESSDGKFKQRCPKCLGNGELDWVESVLGAKESDLEKEFEKRRKIQEEKWEQEIVKIQSKLKEYAEQHPEEKENIEKLIKNIRIY